MDVNMTWIEIIRVGWAILLTYHFGCFLYFCKTETNRYVKDHWPIIFIFASVAGTIGLYQKLKKHRGRK